ncbi:hypothetical protein FB451DRAFT_306981 [Mycena latifolia]|nr:hypothetical protein FB451DRAFT_306981 [Mycena latifolia]
MTNLKVLSGALLITFLSCFPLYGQPANHGPIDSTPPGNTILVVRKTRSQIGQFSGYSAPRAAAPGAHCCSGQRPVQCRPIAQQARRASRLSLVLFYAISRFLGIDSG